MAQHGCLPCSRYFATPVALETHLTGKPHKRRCKILLEEPYTIEESRRAAGQGVDNGEGRQKLNKVELATVNEANESKVMEVEVVAPITTTPVVEGGLVGRLRGAGSAFAALVGMKA